MTYQRNDNRARRRVWLFVIPALVVTSIWQIAVAPEPTAAEASFARTSGRPFASDSAWNTPIVSAPAVDPRSSSQVAQLSSFTHPGVADLYAYGVPVWDADATTPKYTVDCRNAWGTCGLELQPVPIPDGAKPSSGSDGAMVVIDWSTGTAYEFWRARRVSSTKWSAAWGGTVRHDGAGTPGAAVGAGISRLAGVVRAFEVAQRSVNHALVFSTHNACTGTYLYPASKTDGRSTRSDCIPEGARVQLDPTLNVDAIAGMTAAEKMVAKALQTYGAFVIDNGGAPAAFIFETPSGESDPYCSVGLCSDYTPLDRIPWNRLRVLASWNGAPAPPTVSIAPTTVTEPDTGTTNAIVPVSLSGPATSHTMVNYSTTAGSARADSDYVTTSGTILIPAGTTTGSIVVPVKGDLLYEGNDYLTVKISSTTALGGSVGSARVTIKNDDPTPTVTVGNVSTSEGNSGTKAMTFTARLSEVAGVACKVTFTSANATAVANGDYVAAAKRVTIAAGALTATFAVSIVGDTTREASETFLVKVTSPAGCVRASTQVVGSILNDD